MKPFVRRHKRKILFTHSVIIMTLFASSAVTFDGGKATLSLIPHGSAELPVGETSQVDVVLHSSTPVNALSATIAYPRNLLEIIGISKEDSFIDLWTEDTVIHEETGEIHFSGGTLKKGGVVGTSTAITLIVKAKSPGAAQLYFSDATVLASDGRGTTIDSIAQPLTYEIPAPAAGGGSGASASPPPPPDPDLNADGAVNLVDVSILMIKMAQPYDARYDLNRDGRIGLPDLSVVFARMQRSRRSMDAEDE